VNDCGHRFVVVGGNIRFRPRRGQERRSGAVDAIIAGARGGWRVLLAMGLLPPGGLPLGEQEGDRGADQCGAFDSTGATRTGLLQVLEQAREPGRRPSRTPSFGQASIFELAEPARAAARGGRTRPAGPGAPRRAALSSTCGSGKSLGLFLSSHPIKEVRAALKARVECSLAELGKRRDGELVTVGGMISECKRIRTRKGDPMMFATLDDLEDRWRCSWFNSAYAANEDKVDVDKVRREGAGGHKEERARSSWSPQEIEAFRAHAR